MNSPPLALCSAGVASRAVSATGDSPIMAAVEDELADELRQNSHGSNPAERQKTPISSAFGGWWSRAGSNRRPPHCERGALPAELRPRPQAHGNFARPAASGRHLRPAVGRVKNGTQSRCAVTSACLAAADPLVSPHPVRPRSRPCARFSPSSCSPSISISGC